MKTKSSDPSSIIELKKKIKALEKQNSQLERSLLKKNSEVETKDQIIDTSEKSYRALLSNLQGLAYRYTPLKRDLSAWEANFISAGSTKLLGYKPGEIESGEIRIRDLIQTKGLADQIWEDVKEALRKQKSFHVKYPIRTKKGITKWLSDRGSGVYDKNGDLISFEGVITDITKEKNRELNFIKARQEISEQNKIIRERERAYSNLLRNMQGMAYRSTYSGDNLQSRFISEGCLQLTGYTVDEIMSESQFFEEKIVAHEYQESVWQSILNAIEQKSAFEVTYPIITKKGVTRWAYERGIGVFNKKGELEAVEGVIVDVTTAKEHEKQYRIAKETIDKAPIIIEWIKEDGSYHYVNQRAVEVAGWTKEEFYEKKIFEIDPLVTKKIWKEIFTERQKKDLQDFESKYPTKNGKSFPCLVSASNIEFEGTVYNCAYIADISELKAIQNKLKETNDELTASEEEIRLQSEELTTLNDNLEIQKAELEEAVYRLKNTKDQLVQAEKMASLGVLVAGIAHELNNPINYVSTSVEALEVVMEDLQEFLDAYSRINDENVSAVLEEIDNLNQNVSFDELKTDFGKMLVNINDGANQASEIIRGLRTFSRLDKEKTELHNIHDNINNVLLMLRNSYKYNIEIEKQFGDIPPIECAPGQINQVLMNLISNAIHAIDDKGKITIATYLKGSHVIVEVRDTGIGIKEDIQKRIFEPFFTTKEPGKGTGLGLSISLGIIQDHSGSIALESNDEGTTFTLSLPVKQPKDDN